MQIITDWKVLPESDSHCLEKIVPFTTFKDHFGRVSLV